MQLGEARRATSSRTGPRDPSRGVGESPQAGGFGFVVAKCLASAPSGGVHLRDVEGVLETLHLLFRAAEDLARAEAPEPITRAFMAATMTALLKHDGGV